MTDEELSLFDMAKPLEKPTGATFETKTTVTPTRAMAATTTTVRSTSATAETRATVKPTRAMAATTTTVRPTSATSETRATVKPTRAMAATTTAAVRTDAMPTVKPLSATSGTTTAFKPTTLLWTQSTSALFTPLSTYPGLPSINAPLQTNTLSTNLEWPLTSTLTSVFTTDFAIAETTARLPTSSAWPLTSTLTSDFTTDFVSAETTFNETNKTNADPSEKKSPSPAALNILKHIQNIQSIMFSVAGFFLAILFGFACYETYVVYQLFFKCEKKTEPIYATIPTKPLVLLEKSSESCPRSISPASTILSFADRIAKFEFFFSKKKIHETPLDHQTVTVTAHTETAKIHKPYVSPPSFVFNETANDEQELTNETFFNSMPSNTVKKNNRKNGQTGLDLQDVVLSYTNENYVPPSSLPRLPPLVFHTFKRPTSLKPNSKRSNAIKSDPDIIELAPDQTSLPD